MKSKKEMSEMLKSFLKEYQFNPNDLNAVSLNVYKNRPLCFAVQSKQLKNRLSIITELLALGVDPNLPDRYTQDSNLHHVIREDDPHLVELFCAHRADVNLVGKQTRLTPFEAAMSTVRTIANRPKILKILLKFKVKVQEEGNEVSLEELEKIYCTLWLLVYREFENAKRLKKKLMILVGEGHELKYSLLIEIMLLNIVINFGINDLTLEVNSEMLQSLKDTGILVHKRNDFLIMEPLYAVAKSLGMNVFPGDPKHHTDMVRQAGCHDERDRDTSEYLRTANFRNGAISFIGSEHFEGLLVKYPINNSFHVVPINTYPILEPTNKKQPNIVDVPFLKDPRLHQFNHCQGNPELWTAGEIQHKVNLVVRFRQIAREFSTGKLPVNRSVFPLLSVHATEPEPIKNPAPFLIKWGDVTVHPEPGTPKSMIAKLIPENQGSRQNGVRSKVTT